MESVDQGNEEFASRRQRKARDGERGLRDTIFILSVRFSKVIQKKPCSFAVFSSDKYLFSLLDCNRKRGGCFFVVKVVLDLVRPFSLKC